MQKTISFYTLGCRLNQSETAVIERTFDNGDYKIVDFKEPADVVVINTCTVTENGDTDTRRLVNKINRLNPHAQIALIGCQAQIQKEKLAQFPNVRWVVGNAVKMDLRSIVEDAAALRITAPTIPRESFTIPLAALDEKHTRPNLKIQDGCDFFCSFCEIPYARGRARGRKFDDILREAKILAAAGRKELVLTGINVGTYAEEKNSLGEVIEALEQIQGLDRIRISSIEPTTISKKLIEKMAGHSKLCRYLHIPVQSAHNDILKAMKRKYTIEEFSEFIQWVDRTVPQICIGTDVIVGFPGETDQHFQETYERLRELPIHYFHVFSYSARHMAKSRGMSDATAIETIRKRSQILRDLSSRKRRIFYESLLGTTQKVLFEQKKENFWIGLTDNYIRVKIKSNLNLTNQLKNVKLISIAGQPVLGELL